VQAEARALVREQALRRARGSALAARSISDFARFNRVEGVALGAGLSWRLGAGLGLNAQGRHGLDDRETKGRVEARWQNARGALARVYYASDFRDVGDASERSTLINSLAAQEFASDYTDPYFAEVVGGGVGYQIGESRWSLDVARERHRALEVHAIPAHNLFKPAISAAPIQAWRAEARVEQPTTLGWFGVEFRGDAALRLTRTDDEPLRACGSGPCFGTRAVRGAFSLEMERPVRAVRLLSRSQGAAVAASVGLPSQELVFLGGPVSAPGYQFHELVGDRSFSQHVEIQMPVPFPAIPLGRFGRAPARARLAPHATGVLLHQVPLATTILTSGVPFSPPDPLRPRESGFYPSVGASLIAGFDLLRFDVSRGLKDGRWIFSFDVSRGFWGVL
jgi:hypothetical protein